MIKKVFSVHRGDRLLSDIQTTDLNQQGEFYMTSYKASDSNGNIEESISFRYIL